MVATTPPGYGLGVRFDKAPDPRTYAFPLTWAAPAPPPDTDLRPIMWPVQNQGTANSCTGFAGTACLEALLRTAFDPLPTRPPPLKLSELYLYARDRQEDATPLAQDPGASMLALTMLRLPGPAGAPARPLLREFGEGWRQFAGRSWLWLTTVQFALFNLITWAPYLVLGPVLARDYLGGARAWGLIQAASGAGALLAGLGLLGRKPRRPMLAATLGTFGYPVP